MATEVDASNGMSVVEPYGVIEVATATINALEGQNGEIVIWRKFGSQGNIRVRGVASIASDSLAPPEGVAATPSTDFSTQSLSVVMNDGITTTTLSIPIPNNSQENRVRVFWFNITNVERVSSVGLFDSPRLNPNSVSTLVSIIDDEGGSGIFQFSRTTPFRIGEDGNVTLTVTVVRAVSTVGTVRLQVVSMDDEGTYACVCVFVHACVFLLVFVLCMCVFLYMHVCFCMYLFCACVCVFVHACFCACMCFCACVYFVHACVFLCMCLYLYIL